jgi:hypothetical protein
MRKIPDPLTVLERVKGFNIRDKNAAPENKSTREIMDSKVWSERNTKGNPKKKK